MAALEHRLRAAKRPTCSPATVKENIRYGRLDATDEEVVEAAKMVNAHDFITHMEHGYDSDVGEGGGQLSTGEKQLISFARAVLANPRIFVLDEATSSIDTKTEAADPGGHLHPAHRADLLPHCPPAVHHPQSGLDPGGPGREDHRAGHPPGN